MKTEVATRLVQQQATEAFVLATATSDDEAWVIADRNDRHWDALVHLIKTYADAVDEDIEDVTERLVAQAGGD